MRFLRGSVSVSRGKRRNPSVCSLKLAATFPFREDIIVCVVLTIAVVANFYMLPERELVSP